MFSDNGIIERAKNAQNKVDEAEKKDLEEINKLNNWLEENGGISNSPTVKSYTEASKNENGTLKENAKYTDSESAEVTIPKGFKVSDVAGTESTDGEQTVSKGLVIQDKDGNQFVWVPVTYTATEKDENSNGLDDGFEATFKRSTTNTVFTEPYANGYSGENTDYMNMMKSVQANKGFYIGRYEAGIPDEYIERKNEKELKTTFNNKVGIPTSQKGKIPWNYINWSKADESATSMYKDNEYVMSDLITDRQWNYTANWLAECGYNVNDCATWGNYSNVNFEFTGYYSTDGKTYKYAENKMKQTYNMILSTGATERNKANNIYDLAGNLAEYVDVNEKSSNMYDRGGYYDNVSMFGVGSNAKIDISNSNDRQGFRVVLYFK